MPPATDSRRGKPPRLYEISQKFFTETLRETQRDTLFMDLEFNEKEIVSLKPGFDTACWAYLPPHRIYIGEDLFEKRVIKMGMSEVLRKKYIANHYHHERGHAAFTERDMPRVLTALKGINAPFSVFNLFEDARMEHKYSKKAGYQFEWLTMEDLDFSPRAESILFALIQAEGDVKVVEAGLAAWQPVVPDKDDMMSAFAALFAPDPENTRELLTALFPRVLEYYERILKAKDALNLMPILNAWLDEFGRPPESKNPGGGGGMADLELSAELMTSESKAAAFDTDAIEILVPFKDVGENGIDGCPPKKELPNQVIDMPEGKSGTVLHTTSTPVDMARANRLANKFRKFFTAKAQRISTRTPQSRVSARHFAIGRSPYRKVMVQGRGTKKVVVEVDCSGSMGGFHIMEGKLLVTALSILAKEGHVEGHIILSGVRDNGPNWETFKLPMSQPTINRIQGYCGAEGLEFGLRGNLGLLKDADYCFVYTDGQICDNPIDKSFFHRYGVYLWGLYAGGEQSYLEELLKYFDKAILRQDAESLIDAMLVQAK